MTDANDDIAAENSEEASEDSEDDYDDESDNSDEADDTYGDEEDGEEEMEEEGEEESDSQESSEYDQEEDDSPAKNSQDGSDVEKAGSDNENRPTVDLEPSTEDKTTVNESVIEESKKEDPPQMKKADSKSMPAIHIPQITRPPILKSTHQLNGWFTQPLIAPLRPIGRIIGIARNDLAPCMPQEETAKQDKELEGDYMAELNVSKAAYSIKNTVPLYDLPIRICT